MRRPEIAEKSKVLLTSLGIETKANTLVGALPLGEKQKLAFSVASFHNPQLVFLDEPTGGVDPSTRRRFWEMIYEAASRGVTVFVTTHYMDEAEYCDRISMMVDGEIRALDTPDNLKNAYNVNTVDKVFRTLALTAKRN